jgi:oligo-1,6-glucosidase/alpha-glucosidase
MYNFHHPDVIKFSKELREVMEEFPGRFLVGEVFGSHVDMRQLMGEKNYDGLNLVFLFDFVDHFDFSAEYFKNQLKLYEAYYPEPLTPTYVFSNHDKFRSISLLDNNIEKAKLLALFQFTVRGVPFTYQGEEIGMTTGSIPVEEGLDPLTKGYSHLPKWILNNAPVLINRDNCRTPMQWDGSANSGFSSSDQTWLPVQQNYDRINVQDQIDDQNSLLNTYKSLLDLRKKNITLQKGEVQLVDHLDFPKDVLAYIRKKDDEEFLVFLNFSEKMKKINWKEITNFEIIWKSGNDINKVDNNLELPPLKGVILKKN